MNFSKLYCLKDLLYEQEFRDLKGTGIPLTIIVNDDHGKIIVAGFNRIKLVNLLIENK